MESLINLVADPGVREKLANTGIKPQ